MKWIELGTGEGRFVNLERVTRITIEGTIIRFWFAYNDAASMGPFATKEDAYAFLGGITYE